MSVLVLFSALTAAAQQNTAPASQPPVVTKGYYAIGNNAQKLGAATPLPIKAVAQPGATVKGYYAIGKNSSKLPGQAAFIPLSTKRPVATKGYYSIGNNADKLKN